MANTYIDYTGSDGTGTDGKDFPFNFEYIQDSHIKVKINGEDTTAFTLVATPVRLIRLDSTPASDATIKIYRDSRGNFDPLVDFVNGSVLNEADLDTAYLHNLYTSQEASEGQGGEQLTKKGLTHYDAEGNKIINLFAPSDSTDAANKGYVDQTVDAAIALGGSPAIVSLGGYNVTSTSSSTARSLADRFADVVNILDFIPSSEHAAIKAGTSTYNTASAVDNAMLVASASKKTLFFPAGRYVQNSTIYPLSDVHVLGEEGTIIQRGADYGWIIQGADRFTLENLRFDNAATATSHQHKHSVRIHNATDVKILNCTFYNGTDPSMRGTYGPDGLYIRTGFDNTTNTDVNNILVRDCTFDGFSRNGCSVTDGANGLRFENCLFKNCGLTGLDVETNEVDTLQINDLSIEGCSFVDNGDEATRTDVTGGSTRGGGLHIHSVSSALTYISQNVKISNCYFKTKTATSTNGIAYFKINSGKDCVITDCIFDEAEGSSADDHEVTLEESTFGSENIIFKGNRINNAALKTYDVENQLITGNIFSGANFALVSAGQGKTRTVSNNVFHNCGSFGFNATGGYIINFESTHIIISSNTFYDDRDSDVPKFVIDGYHSSTKALELIVANNNAKCVGTDTWDNFIGFLSTSGGSVDLTDIQIVNNYITNATAGINYSSSYSIPSALQIMIQGNQLQNCSSRGIRVYRGSNLNISNNQLTDCGGNGTDAIELNECTKYIVNGNLITDSRTGTDRATYGIEAFNSPDIQNALAANNVTINTQSGNSISANDAVTANNVVV